MGTDARMFGLGCVVMFVLMSLMAWNPFDGHSSQSAKALHHKHHIRGEAHSHADLDQNDVRAEHAKHGVPSPTHDAAPRRMEAAEDFTPKFPEHVKSVRESTWHQDHRAQWQEQGYSRPYLEKEREVPCGNEAATAKNMEGVRLVRAAFDNVGDHYPLRLQPAKDAFQASMALDPNCATPRLNLLIILTAEAVAEDDGPDGSPNNSVELSPKEKELTAAVLAAFNTFPEEKWTAKMYLWRGILEEIMTGYIHTAFYERAIAKDPALKMEYLHPTYLAPTILVIAARTPVTPMIRRALVQLLFFYEYAPALGAYGRITYEDVLRFKRDWHLKVKNFLPPFCYFIVSRYYGSMVARKLSSAIAEYKGSGTYESNGDPLNTWYNVKVGEFMDRLAGTHIVPTYGYTAGYVKGDVLKWHTDRKSCEFTLTTLVVASPNPIVCPLYIQKSPWPIDKEWVGRYEEDFVHRDDVINVQPQLNELVIIRGRAVPHYRPPLPAEAVCATFMLHYVPADEYHRGFHEKFLGQCDSAEQCSKKREVQELNDKENKIKQG